MDLASEQAAEVIEETVEEALEEEGISTEQQEEIIEIIDSQVAAEVEDIQKECEEASVGVVAEQEVFSFD